MKLYINFAKVTNPGSYFEALRELHATLWDLKGHPKLIFWHYAHVSEVEFRENP
jgi:hypothetical protein